MCNSEGNDQERADALLLAYDEALAEGQVPSSVVFASWRLSTEWLGELQAQQRCVQLLEELWPRHPSVTTSLHRHIQAVALANDLRHAGEDGWLDVPRIQTVGELKQALAQSGLVTVEDLDESLEDLAPDKKPETVEQLAYELVQRNILNHDQAAALCRGDLPTLLLGDYLILEELGRGGMGVVYKALDRRRNRHVALKTLHRTSGEAIQRLKREFRSLGNLAHPNVVILDELRCIDGRWFFVMELVEGRHFHAYVCGEARKNDFPTASQWTRSASDVRFASGAAETLPLSSPDQFSRLRESLKQLAQGLNALHQAGILHRDVKPSNVLVTDDGRVVLLDFGMASELRWEESREAEDRLIVGTLSYMSPEQSACQTLTEATDWYSLGVMLWETLAGQRPFVGNHGEMLGRKRSGPPPLPTAVVPAEQASLTELCLALLHPDPKARPTGDDVLRRLGVSSSPACRAATRWRQTSRGIFVGRKEELRRLAEAYAQMKSGRAVRVDVYGESGIGKSSLAHRFLDDLESRQSALVLRGRCHEREMAPHRALDGIVDALIEHLASLPEEKLIRLLPSDLGSLSRLFPTLCQLSAVRALAGRESVPPDDVEVHRRAVESLRELFRRLRQDSPLVLFVDDLQWGDVDSGLPLHELFQPPDPPSLLLVGCSRGGDAQDNPRPTTLTEMGDTSEDDVDRRSVTLAPLPQADAVELVRTFLGRDASDRQIDGVSREGKGNPYFIRELVRHFQTTSDDLSKSESLNVESLLDARIDRLSESAREFLTAVAVSGHPIRIEDVQHAAGLSNSQREVALLRGENLVRTSSGMGHDVEMFHDRIRETITARLSPADLSGYHARLAGTLEVVPGVDPEILWLHFRSAGDRLKAGRYAEVAANQAAESLAFDRAAELYQQALELASLDTQGRHNLHKKRANTLANAGRCVEAAGSYLAAGELAGGAEALDCRRLAAEHFFRAGQVDEGKKVAKGVLAEVGIKLPVSNRGALANIAINMIQLRLRGSRYRERSASEIPAEELLRIDMCWSAGPIWALIEPMQGLCLATRFVLLALRAGEPRRVAVALALDAMWRAMLSSERDEKTLGAFFQRAETLASRINDPYAIAYIRLWRADAELYCGRWRRSLELHLEAETSFRALCTGIHWELTVGWLSIISGQFFLGDLSEMARQVPAMIAEATGRGDSFAAVIPQTYFGTIVWLAADQIEEARSRAELTPAGWPDMSFTFQHVLQLIGLASIDLYENQGVRAWDRITNAWPGLKRSGQDRHLLIRNIMLHLRARAAVAAIVSGGNNRKLIRSARRDARKLQRDSMPWARALGQLVLAGLAAVRGADEEAVQSLESVIREFDAAEMALFAAAARRRLGELIGGDQGQSLIAAGTAFMTGQGVQAPDRMTDLLAPGFARRR